MGSSRHALRRGTLTRSIVPAWAFGLLALLVSIAFFHQEEKRWVQQDELSALTPSSWTKHEEQITKIYKAELLEILDGIESSR